MSKTVISLLIWLVCMPCLAAAETSKELEDALEKAKKEAGVLFDTNETEAYTEIVHKLMDLCLKANDEELYYKSWSNLATFTFHDNPQKGLKVAEEMRDYAKEHDSKYGIITALYTQANMSVNVGMDARAVKLCKQTIEYKNQYLPKVNFTHLYWMLAKIHLVKFRKEEALEALEKCQQEPDLTPYQQMNILAYKCEAAFCKEPVDSILFMTNYTELQKMIKKTGKTSEFFTSQNIHYAELTGQYDKMLELAHQKPNKVLRYEGIYKAYEHMGRWKEAFDTISVYIRVRDSINTADTRRQIEMSSLELETARAENEALSGDDNENGMFVTFWLGLVNLQTGRLDYCNAGHNPPIIGGGDNHGEFLEMLPNAPIGLWPGLVYKGEKIDTIKNRPLFIYTDGLNEAENPQQEQFGDERLLAALQRTTFENARQTINSLKQEVEAFRGDAEPNDDLTMMCINVS